MYEFELVTQISMSSTHIKTTSCFHPKQQMHEIATFITNTISIKLQKPNTNDFQKSQIRASARFIQTTISQIHNNVDVMSSWLHKNIIRALQTNNNV